MSLLALRLRGDLQPQGQGRSILVVAADDDATALDATLELAWCLAEDLGHSVLLVDCAFGDDSLSATLGAAGLAGLVDYLDAGTPADADGTSHLHSLIRATQHARVSLLPQGDAQGARTIGEATVSLFFQQACSSHDFVLLRSSMRADVSRSMAFSAGVDAALLLAVEEETTWAQISRGQRLLNECGARRVALVLVETPTERRSVLR